MVKLKFKSLIASNKEQVGHILHSKGPRQKIERITQAFGFYDRIVRTYSEMYAADRFTPQRNRLFLVD